MKKIPRRELVRLIGRRGNRLSHRQSVFAWLALCKLLEENLSEKDIPKFADLAHAVRLAGNSHLVLSGFRGENAAVGSSQNIAGHQDP